MAVPDMDLNKLSADELKELITKAQAVRRTKVTPSQKVASYVASVKAHADGAQQAIAKLLKAEGVSEDRWKAVEEALKVVQLDKYKDLAAKVQIRQRTKTRRKKA